MVEQLWGDQDDIATLHEIAALLRRGDAEAVDILADKVDSCATHTIFPTSDSNQVSYHAAASASELRTTFCRLRKRMTAQRLEGASLERGASNGPAGSVQA